MALKQEHGTPIHEQVRALMADAYRNRMAPTAVLFSQRGLDKTMYETVPGMDPWNLSSHTRERTRYLGLPFVVQPGQKEDVLLQTVYGGSPEAKAFRREFGEKVAPRAPKHVAITMRTDGAGPQEATAIVIGKLLTKAQLCDIIQAWCGEQKNEKLAVGLEHCLKKWGTFE